MDKIPRSAVEKFVVTFAKQIYQELQKEHDEMMAARKQKSEATKMASA